jgi:hypothetical protein
MSIGKWRIAPNELQTYAGEGVAVVVLVRRAVAVDIRSSPVSTLNDNWIVLLWRRSSLPPADTACGCRSSATIWANGVASNEGLPASV